MGSPPHPTAGRSGIQALARPGPAGSSATHEIDSMHLPARAHDPRRAAITILRPGIDVRAHRPRWRTDRRLGGRSPRSTFVIHCVDVDRRSLRLTAVRSSVDDLLEVTVGPLAEEMSADA